MCQLGHLNGFDYVLSDFFPQNHHPVFFQLDLDTWPHYRPVTPPHCKDDWDPDPYKFVFTAEPAGLALPNRPLGNVLGSAPTLMRSASQQVSVL
jgi:hypothetical protein